MKPKDLEGSLCLACTCTPNPTGRFLALSLSLSPLSPAWSEKRILEGTLLQAGGLDVLTVHWEGHSSSRGLSSEGRRVLYACMLRRIPVATWTGVLCVS